MKYLISLLLIVSAVVAAWWFWPLLADVADMRPRMRENMPQNNDPAVAEMFPPGVEVWPNATPLPTIQSVVDVLSTALAPLTLTPTGQQAPLQVTPVLVLPAERDRMPYTVPAGVTPYSGMPTITETPTAIAETFTLTTGEIVAKPTAEFYATCAYNQAKGQRSRPDCPANAAQLLGAGR